VGPKIFLFLKNFLCLLFTSLFFNGIITLGYYLKKWKKSIIILIPKPGKDQTIPSPYRPISLLSCLCKWFEKCLLSRITPYLGAHNVINLAFVKTREQSNKFTEYHQKNEQPVSIGNTSSMYVKPSIEYG